MTRTICHALPVSKTRAHGGGGRRATSIEIAQITGAKGANNIYAINVPRRDPITEHGMAVDAPSVGTATGSTFSRPGAARRR
jgi:hypothetical protein